MYMYIMYVILHLFCIQEVRRRIDHFNYNVIESLIEYAIEILE